MSTRQILGAVGAAIGGYFGGPQGAQWGWMIGSAIGGVVDPEIIRGPSIGDIANQTSQEGVPRPIVFALSQPMAGNILAAGEPRIVRKRETQGKGGPKVETETVYRTYAIGACEGPITRFVRVWRNGTLVYDVLSDTTTPGNNAKFLEHARFFLGSWDQAASPDLEVQFDPVLGLGNTPTHRGTAYLVMADEDLTDLRGSIPQYIFQVERCEGFYLTSRLYPLENADALGSVGRITRDMPSTSLRPEGVVTVGSIESGGMVTPLVTYDDGEPEAVTGDGTLESGTLVTPLVTYDDGEPEAVTGDGTLESGDLQDALIIYENYPPEGIDTVGSIESGSLV